MVTNQHATPQITSGRQLVEDGEEQLGRQFLDRGGSMKVVHIDIHFTISQDSESADGRGRVVRVHHKIGVFVQGTRRRIRAVGFHGIGARISSVVRVDWR